MCEKVSALNVVFLDRVGGKSAKKEDASLSTPPFVTSPIVVWEVNLD